MYMCVCDIHTYSMRVRLKVMYTLQSIPEDMAAEAGRHDIGVDQGHQQGEGPALRRSEHGRHFLRPAMEPLGPAGPLGR